MSQEELSVTTPKLLHTNINEMYEYVNGALAVDDFEAVAKKITEARYVLFHVTDEINKYEYKYNIALSNYEREWRRSYVAAKERTEKQREERANLECELLENNVIKYKHKLTCLKRTSDLLRMELGVLQTISSNLREQLRLQ